MIKKEVEFVNYNGDTVKQSFFFDLSEAEIAELQAKHDGKLTDILQSIIDAQDQSAIVEYFKEILIMSYGEKTVDGKYFVKDESTKKHLIYSPAYSKIFMELATDADAGTAFVQGILPADLEKRVDELEAKNKAAANENFAVVE